ncbi:cadherin-like domain-containing protein [Nostoc paludosum FACHB-159]|uniref:Cadherin-like domain-containing protein n=1 Tax=Nostoc paludosum FACHB-159 TaxID=2692908 RepID=A0ABR8KBM6_9NOSO|nr:cadherin-like domain-containing protein [Nostoc sp. FACHB-857]MBD2736941.1 cadherin-like domain-containing protein [Nostoc paludosum FACHB-159]
MTRDILRRFTDLDNDTLSISNFTNPTNGTLALNDNNTPDNPSDDFFIYTPNANFNGTDSFTFTVADGNGGNTTGTFNSHKESNSSYLSIRCVTVRWLLRSGRSAIAYGGAQPIAKPFQHLTATRAQWH